MLWSTRGVKIVGSRRGERHDTAADQPPLNSCRRRGRAERLLNGLELFIGSSALAGGLALIARPDGSLLQARLSALRGTPFTDWRIPGFLLAACIGCGSLLAALALVRRAPYARELALLVSAGVIAFEAVEWLTIGFQPLEAAVAAL